MVAKNEHPNRVVFVFVRRAPEHFSLVFVFVEMLACTAMAEGPASTATGSLLGIAATCRQALDKRNQWLLWLLTTMGRSSASGIQTRSLRSGRTMTKA